MPSESVSLSSGSTEPPPEVTSQPTVTPGTPRPLASSTATRYGVGNGLPKYQACWSPSLFTSCAGGPGGSVGPSPPPQAAAKTNPRSAVRRTTEAGARRAQCTGPIASLPRPVRGGYTTLATPLGCGRDLASQLPSRQVAGTGVGGARIVVRMHVHIRIA